MTCVWLSADGCKALPKPGSGCGNGGCGCNGAWYTHTNGTITSAMDGGCLQASGAKIGVSPCTGKSPSSGWEALPKLGPKLPS